MSNLKILTDVELDVRNQQRRAAEQWGGPDADDANKQEEWRSYVRKQVNKMVELDEKVLADTHYTPTHVEDQRQRWIAIAALAQDAAASMDRKYGRLGVRPSASAPEAP